MEAEQLTVVINEISWTGTKADANDEFIELFNNSDATINLEKWKLIAADNQPSIDLAGSIAAHGYFLLERTSDDTVKDIPADQIYAGSLGNGGEKLELISNDGSLVDSVDCSSGWWAGDNATKATMERKDPTKNSTAENWKTNNSQIINGQDADNNKIIGTPRSRNSLFIGDQPPGSGSNPSPIPNQSGPDTSSGQIPNTEIDNSGYAWGSIVINELVSQPAPGESEWVEIYNTTNSEIDLAGWYLSEGGGSKTMLTGTIAATGSGKFKVIIDMKGSLNNDGDVVMLTDSRGKKIDQVAYGDWNSADKSKNALNPPNSSSLARKYDGYNTGTDANDFAVTHQPTKGGSNIISQTIDPPTTDDVFEYNNAIVISEILANPIGADIKNEFIELYNGGDKDTDLSGWRLAVDSGKAYQWKSTSTKPFIKAKSFLVLYRSQSKIALDNDKETVRLYQPLQKESTDESSYVHAPEGQSWNNLMISTGSMSNKNNWAWSQIITPGRMNIYQNTNHLPTAKFSTQGTLNAGEIIRFDASDTSDEDGDDLKYYWDFGDGGYGNYANIEHVYSRAGKYLIKLGAGDGQGTTTKEKFLDIKAALDPEQIKICDGSQECISGSKKSGSPVLDIKSNPSLVINEIFPNPQGLDKGQEWLELRNKENKKINLQNWQIGNKKHYYKFKPQDSIASSSYFLLKNDKSKIDLNNKSDELYLYDAKTLVDKIKYTEAIEGASFARGANSKWFWTAQTTPGKENVIQLTKNEKFNPLFKNSKLKSINATSTTLESIPKMDLGQLIKVKGKVAVEPGILGAQFFYIVGSPGVQVYNYKKDFPLLKVGDYIEVTGELGEVNGERRLKIKAKNDIYILAHQTDPQPLKLAIDEIGEQNVGQLVEISGEITDKKGSVLYVDDGTDDFQIYVKKATGIKLPKIKIGAQTDAVGIISKTKNGLRLLPRFAKDLTAKETGADNNTDPQVWGETDNINNWTLPERNQKTELLKYLLVLAGGSIVVLIGLLIKIGKRGERK